MQAAEILEYAVNASVDAFVEPALELCLRLVETDPGMPFSLLVVVLVVYILREFIVFILYLIIYLKKKCLQALG